jgi:hypothetical protein
VKTATKIQAFVEYYSTMVDIYFSNKLINLRFRLGQVDGRHQVLTHYLLLKATSKANLRLLHYGFKKAEVYTPEFPLLIARCRRDTLRYIRLCRKAERATRQDRSS